MPFSKNSWGSLFSPASLLKRVGHRSLIGLDIGVSGIKAVELEGGTHNKRLIAYNRVPLPWGAITAEGEIKEREPILWALKELFKTGTFSSRHVSVGSFGSSVLLKKITTARMSEEELKEQLYWEAEQYIPFSIEEVNLDFAILDTNPDNLEQMDVLLVAAKKEFIQSLSNLLQEADLKADVIDSPAFSLGNAFEFNYGHRMGREKNALNVLLDLGASATRISVVEGEKTTFHRELRQCGMGCTLMLSERLGVSLEEAEKAKLVHTEDAAVKAIISDFVHGITEEIARTVDYVLGLQPDRSAQGFYYCGGSSRLSGLIESLEKKLPAAVIALNPVQSIAGSGKKMNGEAIRELRYLGAPAVGLALRSLGDE